MACGDVEQNPGPTNGMCVRLAYVNHRYDPVPDNYRYDKANVDVSSTAALLQSISALEACASYHDNNKNRDAWVHVTAETLHLVKEGCEMKAVRTGGVNSDLTVGGTQELIWQRICQHYKLYAQCLPNLKLKTGKHGSKWLQLPKHCHWPGRTEDQEPIMIRPCYLLAIPQLDHLFSWATQLPTDLAALLTDYTPPTALPSELLLEDSLSTFSSISSTAEEMDSSLSLDFTETLHNAVLVTGQSGVGISTLLHVYSWVLASRGKSFVVECTVGQLLMWLWLDYRDPAGVKVKAGAPCDFALELVEGDIELLIVNDRVPSDTHDGSYRVLYLSSPNPNEFYTSGKDISADIYIPPLTKLEQKAIFKTLWPKADLKRLAVYQYQHKGTVRGMDPSKGKEAWHEYRKRQVLDAVASSDRILTYRVCLKTLEVLGATLYSQMVEDELVLNSLTYAESVISKISKYEKDRQQWSNTGWNDVFRLFSMVALARGGVFPTRLLTSMLGIGLRSYSEPGNMLTKADASGSNAARLPTRKTALKHITPSPSRKCARSSTSQTPGSAIADRLGASCSHVPVNPVSCHAAARQQLSSPVSGQLGTISPNQSVVMDMQKPLAANIYNEYLQQHVLPFPDTPIMQAQQEQLDTETYVNLCIRKGIPRVRDEQQRINIEEDIFILGFKANQALWDGSWF